MDEMHSTERGWHSPDIVFKVITIHDFYMEEVRPYLKPLRQNVYELLTVCQYGVLSTARVILYHRTRVVGHYYTLAKQSCGKNIKTILVLSNQ